MKSMKYIQYLSVCLLIPVLFGCQLEQLEQLDGIGSPVQFAVATGYEPETRTSFSGVLTGTSSVVERIDWTDGDEFRVNDGAAQSTDLTVSAHSDNGVSSVATISGTSLVWENSSATFYALYPSPATTGVTASLATNTATGTIPSAQTVTKDGREYKADMTHYGYMCASATANAGSAVSLVFKPLMTAFRFQIYAMEGCAPTANLTSVSLSSATTKLAGDFTATIGANSAFTASVVGTGSNTVSASLGTTGIALSTTEPVTVTLLALPVVQNQLTLTLGFSDNTTRSIPFKDGGSWVSVQPGQKMYVDNLDVPGESRWNYFLGDLGYVELNGHVAVTSGLGFDVTSYRYNTLNPSVNESVAWTVEYSTDSTNWYSTLAAAGIADRFSLSKDHGNGGATGDPVSAQITRSHHDDDPDEYTSGSNVIAAETAAMQAKTIPSGALESGYYDLSKHAVYGDSFYGAPISRETANCYVIDRPGDYKFPVIWGNSIRNGVENTIAYAPQGITATNTNDNNHYMRRFQRHDSAYITGSSIFANTGDIYDKIEVRVIWQTGTNSSAGQILEEGDIIKPTASDQYIKFKIKQDNIRPGNILIGLWFVPGNHFVWSWNIWVTNQDLTPTDNFLPCNLGWTSSPDATTEKYADWHFYVKVKQTGGLEKVYSVHQIGEGTEAGAERGNSLLYQWGRKDPFPMDWSEYYLAHSYTITTETVASNDGSVQPTSGGNSGAGPAVAGMQTGHAHSFPYKIYKNAVTHHWITGNDSNGLIGNLWDATLVPYKVAAQNAAPVKSVYDPSPRGFVVPKIGDYSNFSTSDPSNYVTNQGWNFGTGTGTVFFPLAGGLDESGAAMTGGYYWSTTSYGHVIRVDGQPDQNEPHKYESKAMEFNGTTVTPLVPHYKDELLPVRPVVQTRFQ